MGCGPSQLSPQPGGVGRDRNNTNQQKKQHRLQPHLVELMRGNVSVECPSTAKIVRIFTSSTFTDTRHERNALMERVYPRLKELCQQHGYEFQVVDMRWGIRDEAMDDHMGTELCLREVELCSKLSTGPCFVTFLSHKYGYRKIPREVEASEFDHLLSAVKSEETIRLLRKWFRKDENAVPAVYILQPISSMLPNFRANDEERKKQAKSEWSQQNNEMQSALAYAASQSLESNKAQAYAISVTEAEISRALQSTSDISSRCVWFDRTIQGIENQESSYLLSRYKECLGPEEKDKDSQKRLSSLRDETLASCLPKQNILSYNIEWKPNGIDPSEFKEHSQYIDHLCRDFRNKMESMISSAIQYKHDAELTTPVFEEIVQHTLFCQEKCKSFQGREDTLQAINNYLVGSSRFPLVLHGSSGSGKTSILATAAKQAWELLKSKAVIVIRFIGTTPDSSNIGSLLTSIIKQLGKTYHFDTTNLPPTVKELREFFKSSLDRASKYQPLVLFLDSLDQLDGSGDARKLLWFPRQLPENVRVVLSTLPEEKYEILPRLKVLFPDFKCYTEVPLLKQSEVTSILDTWLQQSGRTLTTAQRSVVEEAFSRCPLPLFLKLSFDQTLKWRSYSSIDTTVLQNTVRGCIDALLQKTENLHGEVLVKRALGYLTLSRSGLSESELEDILSCDDAVLNDVYIYWTPPVRRLPPLLLVRLKAELGQYLVDRGADGVRVFYWYHRQFIEAATDRYCAGVKVTQHMHQSLADFFSGVWAHGKVKPYTDCNGVDGSADRHVTSQPLKFVNTYNRRKLNNQPYHRQRAGQIDLLKKECLCNLEFILAKLKSEGLRQITDNFQEAVNRFPDDSALKTVSEAIQLSQGALVASPSELPSQLITRIKDKKGLEQFLQQCLSSSTSFLLPSQRVVTQTGGPLLFSAAEHTQEIAALDMTEDGKVAVTCALDESVKAWDVRTGKLLWSAEDLGSTTTRVYTACRDPKVIVVTKGYIRAYDIQSGVEAYTLTHYMFNSGFCLAGSGKATMFVLLGKNVQIFSAEDATFTGTASNQHVQEGEEMGRFSSVAGCDDMLAVSESKTRNKTYIFDIRGNRFLSIVIELPISEANMKDVVCCLTFSADRKQLLIGAGQSRDILFFDIDSGDMVRSLPGVKHDRMSTFLHATPDGKFLISSNWNHVIIWDLVRSCRHTVLKHIHRSIVNALTADMKIFVTASNDLVLRIWDISRQEDEGVRGLGAPLAEQQKQTPGDKGFEAQHFVIKSLYQMDNSRFLLLHGSFQHKGVAGQYIRVYDVRTSSVLRQVKLQKSDQTIIPCGNQTVLVGSWNRTIKVFDLLTLTFIRKFQGQLPKMATWPNDIRLVGGREVITTTKGRRHIKVLSVETGKVTDIMKAGQTERISGLQVSDSEKTILASTTKGPLLVFSMQSRNFLFSISAAEVTLKSVLDVRITSQDKFLLYRSDSAEGSSVIVWSLVKRKQHCRLRCGSDGLQDAIISKFDVLADDVAVMVTTDGFVHTINISTGEHVDRVRSIFGSSRLCIGMKTPYFGTYSNDVDNNAVKLWKKSPLSCVASFSPDVRPREVFLSRDGMTLVGYINTSPDPVLWSLHSDQEDTASNQITTQNGVTPTEFGAYKEADFSSETDDISLDPDDPDTDEDT